MFLSLSLPISTLIHLTLSLSALSSAVHMPYLTAQMIKDLLMSSSMFIPAPDKERLLSKFKGVKIEQLPTPAFTIQRNVFSRNCTRMLQNAANLNAHFRAHIKTHKTIEGTELQLGSGSLKTDRIVVSTLAEAWLVLPLVEKKLISDVHFSLPVVTSRLDELAEYSTKVPHLRIMLDNAEQLDVLVAYSAKNPSIKKWSVFIKIDMGTSRAGLVNGSQMLEATLHKLLEKEVSALVEVYGFYCHAGHSYGVDTALSAKTHLLEEIIHAHKAAEHAIRIIPSLSGKIQLSVGATPTAHSSSIVTLEEIEKAIGGSLAGDLELHAGCYPCCDLQQVSTGLVTLEEVSVSVLAEVVSAYPGRGGKIPGEMLINAGVIALAREFSSFPGHGRVVSPKGHENWIVGRLSQEHGILVPKEEIETDFLPLGTVVQIVPQHACIAAAAYPWYYIVEDGVVVDIWVPCKYW